MRHRPETCMRGHSLSPDSVSTYRNGRWACKACHRRKWEVWRAKA